MKYTFFIFLTLVFACSQKQNNESASVKDSLADERQYFNDEPVEGSSQVITRVDWLKKEASEIDKDNLPSKWFIYQGEQENYKLQLFVDNTKTIRKVFLHRSDQVTWDTVNYYFNSSGRILGFRVKRSNSESKTTLDGSIFYSDEGNVLEVDLVKSDGNSQTKYQEYSESLHEEQLEGIPYFSNSNDLKKKVNSQLVDVEFFIEEREELGSANDGLIDDADRPRSSYVDNGVKISMYNDLFVFVRSADNGDKVSWRSNHTDHDPVYNVDVPENCTYRGVWDRFILMEEKVTERTFKIWVYDTQFRKVVYNSLYVNIAFSKDRYKMILTRNVDGEELPFYPVCNIEPGSKGVRYLEVVYVDYSDFQEFKSGQLFCYPAY